MRNQHIKHRRNRAVDIAAVTTMLFMLVGCASTKVTDQPSSATDFSGTWKLNEALSEDPSNLVSNAAPGGRSASRRGGRNGGGRAGGGGAGGGRAGGGPGGGGRTAGGGRSRPAQPLKNLVDDVLPDEDTLVIEQSADKLRMKFGDRGSTYYGFDSTRYVLLAGQEAEQLSGWQKNEFVMESRTDDDLIVTHRWTLSDDGGQVTQVVEISGGQLRAPLALTRVFDRAK